MSMQFTSDQWWKNGVIYCLDVETFFDADGDGVGDLEGLVERMDYLSGIGVTTIWLMPFYPTPNQDDGYDLGSGDADRDARGQALSVGGDVFVRRPVTNDSMCTSQ